MGRGCKKSLGMNLKTRKRLIIRLELDLEPGTSIIFVVEGEVAQELRKRNMDICGIQEIQLRGQEACFIGVEGKRYKLWWLENGVGKSGVRILVEEELCESVVEIRRNDKMMTMCLTFGKEMI